MASALMCAALLAGCGSSHPASREAPPRRLPLVAIGEGVRGPAGFRATLYATGLPDVAALTYDSSGRLWAAAAGLSSHRSDGIYLIATPGARPVRVAAGFNDPLGLIWRGGRLYVASVGLVTALSGFTGTRFRHRRTIIAGPVPRGENNDLVLTRDGRFLMGITATCDRCRPKSPFSGSIVSFRPDGSGLVLYASRIRAPFGLAFYPGTPDLLVSMNQPDSLGRSTPGDWLAVVRPGQSWGFPDCYGQGGRACSGVPEPIATLDRHAAVGSVVIVTGQLGTAVGSAALVAEWQTGKVARVALKRTSRGYRGSAGSLLTGIQNPLALVLAPDGSLLVGDWGSGRIYAIRPA